MAERRPNRLAEGRPAPFAALMVVRRSFRDLTVIHLSPSPEEGKRGAGDDITTMDFSLFFPKRGGSAGTAEENAGAALEHSPRNRNRAGSAGLTVADG